MAPPCDAKTAHSFGLRKWPLVPYSAPGSYTYRSPGLVVWFPRRLKRMRQPATFGGQREREAVCGETCNRLGGVMTGVTAGSNLEVCRDLPISPHLSPAHHSSNVGQPQRLTRIIQLLQLLTQPKSAAGLWTH